MHLRDQGTASKLQLLLETLMLMHTNFYNVMGGVMLQQCLIEVSI